MIRNVVFDYINILIESYLVEFSNFGGMLKMLNNAVRTQHNFFLLAKEFNLYIMNLADNLSILILLILNQLHQSNTGRKLIQLSRFLTVIALQLF